MVEWFGGRGLKSCKLVLLVKSVAEILRVETWVGGDWRAPTAECVSKRGAGLPRYQGKSDDGYRCGSVKQCFPEGRNIVVNNSQNSLQRSQVVMRKQSRHT